MPSATPGHTDGVDHEAPLIRPSLPIVLEHADPDWLYLDERRVLLFLEHSVSTGLQWSVFEPNGEQLWADVRRTVTAFLADQWRSGALKGDTAEQAFFVRCDSSTMTQNDLDNGRLVVVIGVATQQPAEFVVFQIGQWTARQPH